MIRVNTQNKLVADLQNNTRGYILLRSSSRRLGIYCLNPPIGNNSRKTTSTEISTISHVSSEFIGERARMKRTPYGARGEWSARGARAPRRTYLALQEEAVAVMVWSVSHGESGGKVNGSVFKGRSALKFPCLRVRSRESSSDARTHAGTCGGSR